jgi:RNA polymerase sigma-70 factor (ECF subfamily)
MELSGGSEAALAEAAALDIVARIRAGDAAAESELVTRYSRGLAVILRRVTRDPAVADDLRQETFRIGLGKIRRGDLREPARLAGFLASLARNLAIDHYRRSERAGRTVDVDAMSGQACTHPGPLELLLKSEQAALARRVLADLDSDRDREVLTRFYVGEEDKGLLCRDLGLTSLQFNRVLFRARQRYRERYEQARAEHGRPRHGGPR